MQFASDNWAGAADPILQALLTLNDNAAPAYGNDECTKRVQQRIAEIFECDPAIFFVTTGGAANGLALSCMTPSYGKIFCHEESHIELDECAGPEFFTGGAKLTTMQGDMGKITPELFEKTCGGFPERPPHGSPAKVLSLTQLNECGAAYSLDELSALSKIAHDRGMQVHMDGARFANALIGLGVTPAQMSWKAGIDVLSLGGTKNGCLAAEMVIFFNKEKAGDFEFKRKRAGHLLSKQRFISTQFEAWFENDLWLYLARRANAMAQKLKTGLETIEGIEIAYPVDGNEVFVAFPEGLADQLRAKGAQFYPWITPGAPAHRRLERLICSFATREQEIDDFLALVKGS